LNADYEATTNPPESSKCKNLMALLLPHRNEISSLNNPPTLKEVKDSIRQMKYQKAPGPSGLRTDIIKALISGMKTTKQ